MRVLYVSKALVVAAYREKLRALSPHAAVEAVVPERWGSAAAEPGDGVAPEHQPRLVPARLHGRNHLYFYPGAAVWLAAARPDLVHIDEEPYSLVTLQLARHCRRLGVPSLFFAWQNVPRRLPPPFGAVRAAVFRTVRGGIAGTDGAAAVLRAAGFAGPLAVIPQFGVDPQRFSPDAAARAEVRRELGIGADDFVVGFGGRLVREKGVHALLAAAAGLPDAHLLFIGDGPERGALEAAGRASMAARVHFTGLMASLQMPRWLAALDVLALPSLHTRTWREQFGRILIEAMACGVPVVGSDSGEIPAVIGPAGDVVPEGDTVALAAALNRLRRDPSLRTARAAAGRARVVERYTHARIADATAAFYRELLEREAPR